MALLIDVVVCENLEFDNSNFMYLLVLLFPLLAFLQAIVGGFFFGRRLCSFFSLSLLLATAACS